MGQGNMLTPHPGHSEKPDWAILQDQQPGFLNKQTVRGRKAGREPRAEKRYGFYFNPDFNN